MGENNYDLLIIGSGAAGYGAAVYAGRYLMKTLVVTGKSPGGETATAGKIENFPGFKEIDGFELMQNMKEHARALGVEVSDGNVEQVKKQDDFFEISMGDKKYTAKTIIYAQGAERRKLGLPNEKELTGKGIHYCATCDGAFYKGKTVAMVGGGDAGVKGVNLLGQYADKIYLIEASGKLRAEPINLERMKKLGDKVEVLFNTQIKEIVGQEKLEKLILSDGKELVVNGIFIEIGAEPHTEIATMIGVELDERNYIKVNNAMETNVSGVYAAGDTTNFFGSFKQIVTGTAMGSVAATSAYNYWKDHTNGK